MQIPKDQIISLIESRLGGDQAQQASQQLPDQVDHEQHADVLKRYNIDPRELVQKFSGGLGNL
jgi:hypothetical protein